MNNRKISFHALLGFFVLALGAPALRAESDPLVLLRDTVDTIVERLFPDGVAADPAAAMPEVRRLVEERFDFSVISRRAIGRGWNRLSPDQQVRYTTLFADLLMHTYTDRLTGLRRPQFEWGGVQELGRDRVEINSTILYEGERYAVVYRLVRMGGDWQVYDLVIEGVSLVGNFRSQFTSVLDRRGPDALIQTLEDRVAAQRRAGG